MGNIVSAFRLAGLLALLLASPAKAQMVIDGEFIDWAGQSVIDEPWGDSSADLDLGPIHWRLDADGLWISVEINLIRNLQAMENTLSLALDLEAGAGLDYLGFSGIDFVVEFSPRRDADIGSHGVSVLKPRGLQWDLGPASAAGLRSAPTYSHDRFEWLLRPPGPLNGAEMWLAVWRSENELDRSESVRLHVTSDLPRRQRPIITGPDASNFRVMSWNVGGQSVLRDQQPLTALVTALEPDIVLLDEVPPGVDFSPTFGDGWSLVYGTSGGRQRGVIAARGRLSGANGFQHLAYPAAALKLISTRGTAFMRRDLRQSQADGVAASGAVLQMGSSRILLVAMDLQCCGRDGGPEDQMRRYQAEVVRRAIAEILKEGGVDHVLVGGDINLVGSYKPLEILMQTAGPEAANLKAVRALQPDGISTVTWYRDGDVFPPGRLDFLLYSPGMAVKNSVVIDTDMMDAELLGGLRLPKGVEKIASDHRPIVADFRLVH